MIDLQIVKLGVAQANKPIILLLVTTVEIVEKSLRLWITLTKQAQLL